MSIALTKAIKDIQVSLKEVGLYPSKIDGVWGDGSSTGFLTLINYYASKEGKASQVKIGPKVGNEVAFKTVQQQLQNIGLYTGTIDGLWGNGTKTALATLNSAFRLGYQLPKYSACWSKKVEPAFVARCKKWVDDEALVPECLDYVMAIMCFESGGTFRPDIQNGAGANYWGLIQFGTAAATDLGTTLDKLKKMTQMEQLEYVFKYFKMRMRSYKLKSLEDFYMSVFYPAAIGKSPDTMIFANGSVGYRQNIGLDVDKDGKITVGEISVKIYQTYYDGMLPVNRRIV
ncbi:hypothetical protein [Stenotrophomonas phage BUCTxx100]|uniref:peptidoglycan-binding domain-containing protein n=1 Tax=Klebsiella quasipneumoniae TaxID=1463165 RepID=UPI0023B02B04|nr:peptidoglycan-binding domain-containing protein [Klebsiella quasipneumoniae]WPH68759.1 hypothetical protein [Stenotrophomonas phage BUCTxx100]